ncbi:LysR family transcriptional regulator [Saccharibacillus sp. CPCC 101409]|uniref:LysR family transcriptional regulator n=1 Tax=Saccharibacillus sp. CPCC 101409 TaxID=3058041 RepID=UPI0026714070|nr:LysR family transcriptional regulator [Saccharibacillus sp. CPCC 101409]MDO3412410.1 LysR family transcriptional regulator [Saccharibacillus sp. CPCC 101409]
MELLQLQYFIEVARTGHMTEAARRLHVTQSSLSKTIQRLENDLGAPLFDRINRRLQLSEFGKLFLKRAEKALFELEQGRREIRDLAGREPDTLKLAVTAASTLPAILREYRRRMPDIQLYVERVERSELTQRVRRGEVDFGMSSPSAGEGIACRILHVDPIVAVLPADHPLAKREAVKLTELQNQWIVGVKKGSGTRDLIDGAARSLGFELRYVYEGDEPSKLIALAEAGIGIAFIPATAMEKRAEVRYIALKEPKLEREIALLWNDERYMSRAAEVFREVAVEYFEEELYNVK